VATIQNKTRRDSKSKGPATPGRPKDSGSRQQVHPNQESQTGSPEMDKKNSDRADKKRS
jgi:hypothetical protein